MTPPPSPCIGVCVLDPATGWCRGCRRTIEEIAAWMQLTPEEKRAVLARLAARRPAISASGPSPPR